MGSRGAISGRKSNGASASFDPEAEREKIKNREYGDRLSRQKQLRHIKGTKEFEQYRANLEAKNRELKKAGKPEIDTHPSILYGNMKDAEALIDKYRGTGIIEQHRDGRITEVICADHAIGEYYGKKSGYVPTAVGRIAYAQRSAHIYPVGPWEWNGGD